MTIMQRPDKIPAGPTEGRFFALFAIGGFDVQSYPNYQHLVVRFFLVKYNKWYGSLFELHCTKKDNAIKCNYLDFLFLHYYYKRIHNDSTLSAKVMKLFIPWTLLDKACANFTSSAFWKKLDNIFPAAYKRKKYNTNKKSM